MLHIHDGSQCSQFRSMGRNSEVKLSYFFFVTQTVTLRELYRTISHVQYTYVRETGVIMGAQLCVPETPQTSHHYGTEALEVVYGCRA